MARIQKIVRSHFEVTLGQFNYASQPLVTLPDPGPGRVQEVIAVEFYQLTASNLVEMEYHSLCHGVFLGDPGDGWFTDDAKMARALFIADGLRVSPRAGLTLGSLYPQPMQTKYTPTGELWFSTAINGISDPSASSTESSRVIVTLEYESRQLNQTIQSEIITSYGVY